MAVDHFQALEQDAERIERLIAISQDMCAAATEGDWSRVAELASRRDMLMRSAFENVQTLDTSSFTVDDIRELLDANAQLISLAQLERDRCGRALRTQKLGEKARRAYTGIAR